MKLARGKGTVRDAHYLLHEIEELKQLKNIQQETGFDFMGKDYFKMKTRDEKELWQTEFFDNHYIHAHSKALEHEYRFIGHQITKITEGAVKFDGQEDYLKLIFSEPNFNSRQDSLDNMLVNRRKLKEYLKDEVPKYIELQKAATQPVKLSSQIKLKLRLNNPITLKDLITRARQQRLKKP